MREVYQYWYNISIDEILARAIGDYYGKDSICQFRALL